MLTFKSFFVLVLVHPPGGAVLLSNPYKGPVALRAFCDPKDRQGDGFSDYP